MFSMKSIKKRLLGFSNNEKGFTLIEIIAVLVILGIMAAVAIPKYQSFQENARTMSAQAAVAELQARANSAFASLVLDWSLDPAKNVKDIVIGDVANLVADLTGAGGDDYDAVFNNGAISVTKVRGDTLDFPVTSTWTFPTL